MRSHGALIGAALLVASITPHTAAAQEIYNLVASTPPLTVHGQDVDDGLASMFNGEDTVAAGDLNGDTVPDLVIGVNTGDGPTNSQPQLGEVHVFFGPLLNGQSWDLAVQPADLTIYGPEVGGGTGSAVQVVDIDGDGAQDLMVGSPAVSRPYAPFSSRGEIEIFYGPLAPGVIDLAISDPGLVITGGDVYDAIGEALAVGDLSGDGIPDLVAGDELGFFSSSIQPGGAHVLFGPLLPGSRRDLATTPPDFTFLGTVDSESFAHSVRIADVSGDGAPDLIVSVPWSPGLTGGASNGRVVVKFGPLITGTRLEFASNVGDVNVWGADDRDNLGMGLDVADLDGDGVSDIIIGANRADGAGNLRTDAGEVHVLFGPLASGTIIDNVTTLPDIVITCEANAHMGHVVAATAMPGNGMVLAMGAVYPRNECESDGQLRLMKQLPPRGSIVDLAAVPPDLLVTWGRLGLDFGGSCYFADLDGDALPELLGGGSQSGPVGGRSRAGALYVVGNDDRCEQDPPEFGPSSLTLRRTGFDVLLDFDTTGFGVDSIAADIFRGTIASLWDRAPFHDHEPLPGGCGASVAPFMDAGAAAPSTDNYYYLIARGCPASCWRQRFESSLGTDSFGVERPQPGPIIDLLTCR